MHIIYINDGDNNEKKKQQQKIESVFILYEYIHVHIQHVRKRMDIPILWICVHIGPNETDYSFATVPDINSDATTNLYIHTYINIL